MQTYIHIYIYQTKKTCHLSGQGCIHRVKLHDDCNICQYSRCVGCIACFTLLCFALLCFTLLYFALLCCILLSFTLLYFTLSCFTLLFLLDDYRNAGPGGLNFELLYFELLYFALLYFDLLYFALSFIYMGAAFLMRTCAEGSALPNESQRRRGRPSKWNRKKGAAEAASARSPEATSA